ncbi:Lipoate-protein ligase A subunit 2 [uncultured archaeon]|nr:Lipoate-protein ligase A subunit 2 [uncultured archaeon]
MKENAVLRKSPGGKLLRTIARTDGGKIISIKFTGDYFAHPEEAVEQLEAELIGCPTKDVATKIRELLKKHPVEFYGITPEELIASAAEAAE